MVYFLNDAALPDNLSTRNTAVMSLEFLRLLLVKTYEMPLEVLSTEDVTILLGLPVPT